MKIVIDSNILLSALIKDSTTRKIIMDYEDFFLFPQYIFEEFQKYSNELLEKSRLSKQEFNTLFSLILTKVVIVPNEVIFSYRKPALDIVGDIDKEDAAFFACALAYPGSVIWSNDKKLKNQNSIIVLNTNEIENLT